MQVNQNMQTLLDDFFISHAQAFKFSVSHPEKTGPLILQAL